MAIGSYPRVTVQGTGATNNIQNGLGLMVLNPSTSKYEAATAATFAGGGGGGDATAANQTTQIGEATTTNTNLTEIVTEIQTLNSTTATAANQTAQIGEATTTNNKLNEIITEIQILNSTTATAANQTTQITEAQTTNNNLYTNGQSAAEWIEDVETWTKTTSNYLIAYGKPAAEYLNDIALTLLDVKNLLTDIKNNQTNGSQRTVLQDSGGNLVSVTSNALNVDTGA
jgi:hypothetical protein